VSDPFDLETERRRADGADLDAASTRELVGRMVQEDKLVPLAVERAADAIAAAIDLVAERLEDGGRLIYVGAGTSGRIGVMDAVETRPTFSMPVDRVVGVLAGGIDAFASASEGAEDDEEQGAREIDDLAVGPHDVVVGITASGRTPFVIGAIGRARERGAATVGVSSNPGAQLSEMVDRPIEVVVGPELIAGSTRLKAGTAQKLVLNMISTISMIRIGRTYKNLMIGVRATNDKLRLRARRIVEEATGAGPEEAATALEAAGGEIPTAIVMILRDVPAREAADRLAAAGGNLRAALGDDS
jgi:N-acetylmuramic acid 6-phosphate etherase